MNLRKKIVRAAAGCDHPSDKRGGWTDLGNGVKEQRCNECGAVAQTIRPPDPKPGKHRKS